MHRIQNGATNGRVGYCLDVIDLFMSKAFANRPKDRDFNMGLLKHGFIHPRHASEMVLLMPVDEARKRAMRAQIRRWVAQLRGQGYDVPEI